MRLPLRALGLASLSLLAACSTLPDYARPTFRVIDPATYGATDAIPYRDLSRDDFRGTSPPERIASHASKFGAYTCAGIVPESFEFEFTITLDPVSGRYIARPPGLRFRAEMDRECSWWNPKATPASAEYILQHEQIHFAIIELQARSLEEDVGELRGRGNSPQAAANDLQRALDSMVQEATNRVLTRSTRFDEDTSFVNDPERQAQWADQVRNELERISLH